ncbi:MAG: DNA polymerase II large subunit [archaeon]|nr:DNA polymerase II large subunit [archaeon]
MSEKAEIIASPEIKKYFAMLNQEIQEKYKIAQQARSLGKDPILEVESLPVHDLAERTESIVGPKGVAVRFREVFKEMKGNRLKTTFKIFEEIVTGKLYEEPDEAKRLEQGIKTAMTIETEGVVVSPIDGVPKVEINKNPDGSRYVDVYYAGPIRAAGGKISALPLMLGDYARKFLELGVYKPTDEEVERYVEEVMIYQHEIISRQLVLTEDEIRLIARNCPTCINGVPTEEREVAVHKDLPRIPSNRIRGGAGLVITEGVALKADWILEKTKQFGLDWSWLEKIIKIEKKSDSKIELKKNFKYLNGLAAGRPLLCYPMAVGGFRGRYGRGRNTGLMAKAINPSTMILLDEFIAVGTHIKIERPGKAAQLFPCTTIDGPIVLLKNGEVMRVNSKELAEEIRPMVKKILFLGDLLIPYGDYRKSAHPLTPSPYVEEWYALELQKAMPEKSFKETMQQTFEKSLIKNENELSFKETMKIVNAMNDIEAVEASEKFKIPLNPKFIHYYKLLELNELKFLTQELHSAEIVKEENKIKKIRLIHNDVLKSLLEKIGIPHKLVGEKIVIEEEFAFSFLKTFGVIDSRKDFLGENIFQALLQLGGIEIKDKCGTFIGARMGRPEQAKPREMKGNPHSLFPIALTGGATRSMNKSMDFSAKGKQGMIQVEISLFKCPQCSSIIPTFVCNKCNVRANKIWHCAKCSSILDSDFCKKCNIKGKSSSERNIEFNELMNHALSNLKTRMPDIVKGVKGLISDKKIPEALEKGILRSKHGIHVFRDGTTRFELLNAVITHFKPREIGLSVEKVKEFGYSHDIEGKEITSEEQIIEIFPQDIIVNETCGDWLVKVAGFCDELLEKVYMLPHVYDAKTKNDLIGELVIGLAPHTSAGVVARIIGYTKARVGFGHPYFITAKRRNCLTGDTPVLIQNGHKMKSVAINHFDDGSLNEEIPLENVFTYTIDEQGKLQTRKVNALLKQKSPKQLLQFKTKYGREITTTPNHKLLTFDGKKVFEKECSEFKEGEPLLSLHSIQSGNELKEFNVLEFYLKKPLLQKKLLRVHGAKKELVNWIKSNEGYVETSKRIGYANWKKMHTAIDFNSVPLNLFELLLKDMKKETTDFSNARIGYNKQKSTIPAIIKFNKELGEIIGYFLADGYSRTTREKNPKKFVYQVNFVSDEREITQRMHNSIKQIFGRETTIEKRKLDHITLSGRVYYEFFTEMLSTGSNAKNKRVPYLLLNSPKDCLQGLLAGYIVGDGHINENSIKMTSINQGLINDFGLVCNLLGLFPHFINEKEREIKSGYLKEFYAKKGKTISVHSFGIRLYSEDLQAIGKYLFGKKAEKFEEIMQTHNFRKKYLKTIGNFALDPIVEIKKIESKEEWVYDLMVEGEKNYIAGFGNLAVYDCDGDQDSVMLLMDALLNFSESYLSIARGNRMDAPLVFTTSIKPTEIDNEAYEMETTWNYPLEFYEKTLELSSPFLDIIPIVEDKLGKEEQYEGIHFTHDTEAFDEGPKQSAYVRLKTMEEKIKKQAQLQSKIMAVEEKDALERVMNSHFLPDLIGNTRAFSRQTFRCTTCNSKYRRVPLIGKCVKCNGNIILTINEGSVKKYLKIAKELVREYNLSEYMKQRIELTEKEIKSVFEDERVEQKSLFEYL